MQDFEFPNGGENMGGTGRVFYIIPENRVSAIGTADDKKEVSSITLTPGSKFTTVYATEETGVLDFGPQGEIDGGSFRITVGWKTPGYGLDNLVLADSLVNGAFIVLARDTAGKLFIVGSKDYPAYRENLAGVGGVARADRKHFDYLLFANSPKTPNMFTGSLTGLIIPRVVAEAASSASDDGFTANWATVSGASGYLIDVATDKEFKNTVVGYNRRPVTAETLAVTGLAASTVYYYRVRAVFNDQVGAASNTIFAQTTAA